MRRTLPFAVVARIRSARDVRARCERRRRSRSNDVQRRLVATQRRLQRRRCAIAHRSLRRRTGAQHLQQLPAANNMHLWRTDSQRHRPTQVAISAEAATTAAAAGVRLATDPRCCCSSTASRCNRRRRLLDRRRRDARQGARAESSAALTGGAGLDAIGVKEVCVFVILTVKNANSVLSNCRNALNAVDSWFARAAPMFATIGK
jgi:hypothetical protein